MITIHDLLQDSPYKEFLCTVPKTPAHLKGTKPWRLMVILKGESHWKYKRFETYKEAFTALKKLLPRVSDAAINSPGFSQGPPSRMVRVKGKYFTNASGKKQQVTRMITWQPRIPADEFEAHDWCPYCRRPTVFKRFMTHHALPPKKLAGMPIDPNLLRCSICGASENIVSLRRH